MRQRWCRQLFISTTRKRKDYFSKWVCFPFLRAAYIPRHNPGQGPHLASTSFVTTQEAYYSRVATEMAGWSSWDDTTRAIRITAFGHVYPDGEYCESMRGRGAHTYNINVSINENSYIVTKCLHPTLAGQLNRGRHTTC